MERGEVKEMEETKIKVLSFIEELKRNGEKTFYTPYQLGTPIFVVGALDELVREKIIQEKHDYDNNNLRGNIFYEIN